MARQSQAEDNVMPIREEDKTKGQPAGEKSVAGIMRARQDEVLASWIDNIISLSGTRVLELMTEAELRKETTDLLATLMAAAEDGVLVFQAARTAAALAVERVPTTSRPVFR